MIRYMLDGLPMREYSKQEREVICLAFHCKIFLHEIMMGAAHGELPHHISSPEAKAEWEHIAKEAEKLHDMFNGIEGGES